MPSRASESSSATRIRRPGRVSGSISYLSSLSAWPMVTSGASPVPARLVLFREPPPPRLVVERLRRRAENDRGPRLVVVHGLEGSQDELALTLLERGAEGQEHRISLLAPLCRGDAQREEDWGDELLVAAHHRPLDDVAELADVAGPRVIAEAHQGRRVHPLDLPSVLLVELGDEGLHEERDVLGPLAQRRERDGQHIDPIVQILPEGLVTHSLGGVAVGRGHDPNVNLDLRLAPDPANHAVLENAEILHLQSRAHLRDLVEEDGAAVGQLEETRLTLVRAGEGPFFVAEELALHQRLGDGRAVDGDERPLTPIAHLMNGPGDQLFARSRLAGDQHRGVAGPGQLDQPIDLLHCRARAQDGAETTTLAKLPAQECHLALDFPALHRLVEEYPEAPRVHRLGQVVVGPLAHGRYRRLHSRVTGKQNDHGVRVDFVERLQERDPVQGRHHQIGDNDGRSEVGGFLERLLPVDGLLDLVSPGRQQIRQRGACGLVVVCDQNAVFHGSLPRSLGLRPWRSCQTGHDYSNVCAPRILTPRRRLSTSGGERNLNMGRAGKGPAPRKVGRFDREVFTYITLLYCAAQGSSQEP